jgi:hypothetical protein
MSKLQKQRKQRMVDRRRRAKWQAAHGQRRKTIGSRIKKAKGQILDLLVMPFFYVVAGWIRVLRELFNVS